SAKAGASVNASAGSLSLAGPCCLQRRRCLARAAHRDAESSLDLGSAERDPDARPHGRGDEHCLEVLPLGSVGLGAFDGSLEGVEVVGELLRTEARLADRGVHYPGLVGAELDLARLERTDYPADVGTDRARLRV